MIYSSLILINIRKQLDKKLIVTEISHKFIDYDILISIIRDPPNHWNDKKGEKTRRIIISNMKASWNYKTKVEDTHCSTIKIATFP